MPTETGGILLGFRLPDAIVVTRAATVNDPRGTRRSYHRRQRHAQTVLQQVRDAGPSVVGYVGEWHTHPGDEPPSNTDRRSLRDAARHAAGPVLLLVVAFPGSIAEPRLHALCAQRHDLWRIAALNTVDISGISLTVLDEPGTDLEREADTMLRTGDIK